MNRPGGNPVVTHLLRLGRRVTEESYLQFAYPDGVPNPRPAELKREAEDAVRQAIAERDRVTVPSQISSSDDGVSQSLLLPNRPPRSPLTRSIRAYAMRFRTKVPAYALKDASQSRRGATALQTRLDQALRTGHPDPEWEQHLQRVRSLPDSELSVEDRADKEPLRDLPELEQDQPSS